MRGSDWQDMGASCTRETALLAISQTASGSLSTAVGECAEFKSFRRCARGVCLCAARGVCCIVLTTVD
jgi:hypothetical protein